MPVLAPLLTFLDGLSDRRPLHEKSIYRLLSPAPSERLVNLLSSAKKAPLASRLGPILESIVAATVASRVERRSTDWPFEYFWTNPSEPRHSKLLRYFLDPAEDHRCGNFLLEQFVDVLARSGVFPEGWCSKLDGCEVSAEADYIDLLILRDQPDGKYAIIVENKINGAVDQDKQLSGYAAKLLKRGFNPESILAIYLPLNGGRTPSPEDQAALQRQGVRWKSISFERHVLAWLNAALDHAPAAETSDNLLVGIRQNLGHYRSLLLYLLNQNKQTRMDANILDRLNQAQETGELPTWQEVEQLRTAVGTLQQGLEIVLRGRLFLSIKKRLEAEGFTVEIRPEKILPRPLHVTGPFDPCFSESVSVCAQVDDSVSVCLGGEKAGAWTGYMRNHKQPEATGTKLATIIETGRRRYGGATTNEGDAPWYKWGARRFDYLSMDKPSAVDAEVDLLKEMRAELLANFGEQSTPV